MREEHATGPHRGCRPLAMTLQTGVQQCCLPCQQSLPCDLADLWDRLRLFGVGGNFQCLQLLRCEINTKDLGTVAPGRVAIGAMHAAMVVTSDEAAACSHAHTSVFAAINRHRSRWLEG
jgi:hypothetical protein